MHKTKLALVGAGTIGQRHLQAISQVEEAELTAIVDNQAQAESISKEMNVPFFNTTEEMLHALKPEGVIVCNTSEYCNEVLVQSARAGKSILCETPNYSHVQARKIWTICQAYDVLL